MSHVDEGQLHAYLDGELSPAEAGGVDAHLAQCPDCRRRLEEERALIARAAELLSLAAPPDRGLPPFRAGDVKPPARLWWQVRLPLAWAATVLLALGIGTYLGRVVQPGSYERARDSEATPRGRATEPGKQEPTRREARVAARSAAPKPPTAKPAPEPARAPTDSIAPLLAGVRRADAPAARGADAAQPSPTGALFAERKVSRDDRDRWQRGSPISVDSARHVLGADPLVVPGVPIEAFYRGRAIGYADVVIVEQALDSTTTIEVINARAAPQLLEDVVVRGQAATPSTPPFPADSLAPRAKRPMPMAAKPAAQMRLDVFRDVRGPLAPDSLAALRRRLQPLRAATGP